MSGLTVACVLNSRQGKRGKLYSAAWVYALKRGVSRHLDLPYRSPLQKLEPGTWTFRCLSDVDLGPMTIPLEYDWPSWWAKLELFRLKGRVLYFDLDTLIVGDLSDIAAYDGPIAMLSDFYQPSRRQSGMMAFTAGEVSERLWETWIKAPEDHMRRYRGDGEWLHAVTASMEVDWLQGCFPRQIVSLKSDCRPPKAKGPPEGARVVCGHGRPRLNEPTAGWAHEAWLDLSRSAA